MLDITTLKSQLETDLEKCIAELSTIAIQNDQTGDWEALPVGTETANPDETDEADVVEDWNERRATVAVLETDYRNYRRALQKIKEGTYGICEISGEPIEPERLEANPAARTCIAHREEEDILSL